MKIWKSPAGELSLERYPFPGEKSHRAWDAADEWIVQRFPGIRENLLITGEAFGALSCAWGRADIVALNDSSLSLAAAEHNRKQNLNRCSGSHEGTAVTAAMERPRTAEKIFIRLPKDLELLEIYILQSLRFASEKSEIWVGGMDRRWSSGVKKITDRYLRAEEIFPFERRARWIRFSTATAGPDVSRLRTDSPGPDQIRNLEEYPVLIKSTPAVFSARKTDGGTAAFLKAFPETEAGSSRVIADMGCGSGILGLLAAVLNTDAEIIFSDESFLAVSAAKENAMLNGIAERSGFLTTNGLFGVPDESADLVLCNPPFHFQNIQTIEPAQFMFHEAARVLRSGGTIQIVGNSHLGYHKHLKKYFPDSGEVLRTPKFTVIRGIKT